MQKRKINFITDIRPDRFIVYENGVILDTFNNKIPKEYMNHGRIYVQLCGKLKSKNWIIGTAFQIKDHEFIDGSGKNTYFKYNHRNGFDDDFSVNNLNICLVKSNITTDDCRNIYRCLLNGIKDPYAVSITIGKFVHPHIIERLLKGKTAEILANFFNVNYHDLPLIPKAKRKTPHMRLTDEQIIEICEALKNYGSPQKASEHITFATKKQIQAINERRSYPDKTKDILPMDIKETSKKFAVPQPEDSDDEKWKKAPSHLLPDERVLYVSSCGRFITNIGDELYVKKSSGYARVDIYGKRDCHAARIILATFDIDLPHLLNVPYDEFNVGYKDENRLNIAANNLYWIPYKNENGGRVKHLTISKLNTIIETVKNEPSYRNPDKLRELCLSLDIDYRAACYIANGTTFSHFIYDFDNQNWKPLGYKNYYISDTGLVRHFHSLVRTFKVPDDERNHVKIDGKDNLVAKLVLKCFGVAPGFKPAYPHHKDGDFTNDNISNLEWSNTPEQTTVKKRKSKYGIKHEESKPLDWIEMLDPSRYTVSNLGRVFDSLRNRYVESSINKKGKNKDKLSLMVRLRDKNNNIVTFTTAQLVKGTFDHSSRNKLTIINKNTPYVTIYKDGDFSNITFNNIGLVHRSCIVDNAIKILKKDLSGKILKIYQSMTLCVKDNPGVSFRGLKKHMVEHSPYCGFLWEYV